MGKVEMICYKSLDEIFDNLDSFLALAHNEPDKFKEYLLSIQRRCEYHVKRGPIADSENISYAARDLSAKVILEFGIYESLDKVQVLQKLLDANRSKYLPIVLGTVQLEIKEVLETTLIHKLPKLLELTAKGNSDGITSLLKQEDTIKNILGDDGNPVNFDGSEQTTLYTINRKKKRRFRYDIYLRYARKLNSDDFIDRLVHTIIGKEAFTKQMGDLICLLTGDEKIYRQIHPSIIPILMSLVDRVMSNGNQEDEDLAAEINSDQLMLDMDSAEQKLKLQLPSD